MPLQSLKRRVDDRDRLVLLARAVEHDVHDLALTALARGDSAGVEEALADARVQAQRLAENLRVYQAELRAQAEELAASQERTEGLLTRFASLFANLPVATLLVTMNGEITDQNVRARGLLGLRPGTSAPRFLHRLVAAAHYQTHVRPAFHAAADGGAASLSEVPFVGEDGRRFVGELHLALMPAQAGEPAAFACTVIDRSEHLQHLRALRESAQALHVSEGFLAETTKVARIAGWELPAGGAPLRASPALCELLDLPGDATPDLDTLVACCDPAHAKALLGALDAARRDGRPFEIELDLRTRRGRTLRVLAAGHAEPADGGSRVFGVFQDVSSQHAARRRIDQLTERLNLATDAGGIGIWDWDLEHRRLFVDPRVVALLGSPAAADLHAAFAGRLDAADADALDRALEQALAGDGRLSIELPVRPGGDGREHWLHLSGRVQRDAAGRPERVVGCLWDCTPEHEASRLRTEKESAVSASRAKSALLSRVSHELRTPLNAILGFTQLMQIEAEHGDLVVKPHRVQMIDSAARHLLALINEVLDVSHAESGRVELHLDTVDLTALVADCLPLVQLAADRTGVSLHHERGGAPLHVRADRLRLKQVLLNLLSNAVKYNRPAGSVTVSAHAVDGAVALQVRDTGRGMSPEQLGGLFQPFNRLGAESSAIEGSGMGLFVSQRFVELMGGHIDAESTPGAGTTFTVRLVAAEG